MLDLPYFAFMWAFSDCAASNAFQPLHLLWQLIYIQVFHNPGVVPDSRYLPTADSTVVFEATYDTFKERKKAKVFKTLSSDNRGRLCAIIHSVPDYVHGSKLRKLVKQARKVAEEVYITHLRVDYYAGFGHSWGDFVDLMSAWIVLFISRVDSDFICFDIEALCLKGQKIKQKIRKKTYFGNRLISYNTEILQYHFDNNIPLT